MGINKESPHLPLFLSIYGGPGLTAILSLKTIDEQNFPKNGQQKTLVVSSAAGSTGSLVVQLAIRQGFRVICIVGS